MSDSLLLHWSSLLSVTHLIGVALGVGAATVKPVLFGAIWVVGPVIDHVVEPRFQKLATGPGESATPAFASALRQYLVWETVATSLFYVIIVMWVFR